MANSNSNSPWKNTPLNKSTNEYMDFFRIRAIPASSDDVEYTIAPQYNQRPDLLAHDIYNDVRLWWVFAQRNMDVIEDPIYDFKSGTTIKIPKGGPLKSALGGE